MSEDYKIVLFDGVCNLCNSSVQFLLKHDKRSRLKYASLQSKAAGELLADYPLEEAYMNSIVFLDEGELFIESDAVLRIARYLDTPWKYAKYLKYFPRWLRNRVYRFIARNRYRWFGKRDECMIPNKEVMDRFL